MAPATPWWINLITFALAIGGVLLGIWALWWDRAHGRLRCPKCWYDMRGAKVGESGRFTCPECGRAGLTVRNLRRTRRHSWWAGFAVLMIAAAVVMVGTRKDGPLSLIPSWVLVRLPAGGEIEWFDDELWGQRADNWRVKEIQRRNNAEKISTDAMRHWLARVEDALRDEGRWGVSDLTRVTHQRLQSTIVDREFKGLPAADVLEELGQIAAVPIKAAWEDLDRGGSLYADSTVTFSTRGLSVLNILNQFPDNRDYGRRRASWTYGPDGVLVGTESTLARMRVVQVYDVQDLVESVERSAESGSDDSERTIYDHEYTDAEMVEYIAYLLIETIDTDGWTYQGGDLSAMECAAERIIVDTHPAIHLAIEDLLERLRMIAVVGDETRERNKLESLRSKVNRLAAITIPCEQSRMRASDVAALISEFSPFEVAVDWEAMELSGIEPDNEIAIPRGDTSLVQLLQRFTELERDFPYETAAWTLCDEQLLLTSDEGARRYTQMILYEVSDLVSEVVQTESLWTEDGLQSIVDLVVMLVDTEGWRQMGGETNHLEAFGNVLIISTTPRNHLAIDDLLRRLRAMALFGDEHREREELDSLRSHTEQLAATTIPCERPAMTAAEVVALIREHSQCEVVVGWNTTVDCGVGPDDEIAVPEGDVSVLRLLKELVNHCTGGGRNAFVGWTFQDDLLHPATGGAGPLHMRIVMYDLEDLLNAERRFSGAVRHESLWAMADLLVELVDTEGWTQMGGETGQLNAFGDVLIIENTPWNHVQIDSLLSRLRRVLMEDDITGEAEILRQMRAGEAAPEETGGIVIHRVANLLAADDEPPREGIQRIAEMIRDNVELESWDAYGGDVGKIIEFGNALVIQTTPEIHLAVEDYLNTLRK